MHLSFLHTSDWHIGKHFTCPDSQTAWRLSLQRLEIIEKIIEQANKYKVDGILVCGDTFDNEDVSDKTLKQLTEYVSGFQGLWFFLPGNHDPLCSVTWEKLQKYVPRNMKILSCSEPWSSPDKPFTLFPAPWTSKFSYEDPTRHTYTSATTETLFRVGVAHGTALSYQECQADQRRYDDSMMNVSTWIKELQLHYLALGHWHKVMRVSKKCWYSGPPEIEKFPQKSERAAPLPLSEPQKGEILHVHLTAPDKVHVTPITIGRFGWMDLGSLEYESLATSLKEIRDPQTTIVQATLQTFDQESMQQWSDIKNTFEDSFFWFKYKEKNFEVDLKGYRFPEGSFLEVVAERLRVMMEQNDVVRSETARQALDFLIKKYEALRDE